MNTVKEVGAHATKHSNRLTIPTALSHWLCCRTLLPVHEWLLLNVERQLAIAARNVMHAWRSRYMNGVMSACRQLMAGG